MSFKFKSDEAYLATSLGDTFKDLRTELIRSIPELVKSNSQETLTFIVEKLCDIIHIKEAALRHVAEEFNLNLNNQEEE